jgi:predicted dehydrogenase
MQKGIVIGCGNIGALLEAEPRRPKPATHAGALSAHAGASLVALVDTNSATLAKAGKLFPQAKLYTDLSQCLKLEKPTLAVVATPPQVRRKTLEQCIKAGVKNIVCEKPLAHSLKDAEAIERLVKKYKLNFVLNYQRRFFSLFTEAKAAIADKKIGKVLEVSCYYSNGLSNNGGHTIDALEYLLDDQIVSVLGVTAKLNKTYPRGDANIDGLLTTKKGVHITMQSIDQSFWGIHDIRIFGTKGVIELTDFGYTMRMVPVGRSLFSKVPQLSEAKAKMMHRKESMVGASLEAALKKKGGVQFAKQGRRVLQVLEALHKSAALSGKQIRI